MGHTYLPPSTAPAKAASSQLTQTSKENTPMPDAPGVTKRSLTSSAPTSLVSARLLADSFSLSLLYGEDYTDESPVTGYPGEFHLSSTGRKEREKLLAATAAAAKAQVLKPSPLAMTAAPEAKAEPPVTGQARKSSRSDKGGQGKPKRRKSKGGSVGS